MKVNTDLIVLHTTKIKEDALVVHTYSAEWGRRGFIAHKVGRKFPPSFFLPLNILEADISINPKSTLHTLMAVEAKHPLMDLRNNLYKNAMSMFISEVLYRTLRDGAKEAGLFEWLEKNILLLDAVQSDFSNFHIKFLTDFCGVLGFSPRRDDIEPFMGELTSLVANIMDASFEEAMLLPMSGTVRNHLAAQLLKYIEFHSESEINIRSLKVLHELLR